jgi:hypothetical protein
VQVVLFHDWKNDMGNKQGRLKIHAQSERYLKAFEMRENFVSVSNLEKPSDHTKSK